MNSNYLQLSEWQIFLASGLIFGCALLSFLMRLGLEKKLLIAGFRTVVQLALMGFVLNWVFSVNRWPWVVLLGLLMTLIAGYTAVDRVERTYPGIFVDSVVSVGASSWLITGVSIFVILRVTPWYSPRYLIPFLGMILGNSLNGISLGLDRFSQELINHRDQIDAHLALGASRWEAARPPCTQAIRTGMIPIINSMMVVGIVNIPGMMTGQLLGGIPPLQAVRYQIVMMFLITAASTLGTIGVVLLGYRKIFNSRQQFLFSKLQF